MLKPLGNKLLIRAVEDGQDVTKSGIIIQKVDGTGSKVLRAVVVAVGEGKLLESGITHPISLEEGCIVWVPKYAVTDIRIDEVDYKVVPVTDVIAVEVYDAEI